MQKWKMAAFVAASAVAGYAAKSALESPGVTKPITVERFRSRIDPGQSMRCHAIVSANAVARAVGEKVATAQALDGTDSASIRITADGRQLYLLSDTAVRIGVTEADPMPIVELTADYIVASETKLMNTTTITIDRKTGKVIWAHSGAGIMGLNGQTIVLDCR